MFAKILSEVLTPSQKIAVAAAHDKPVLEAVFKAKELGVALPILVGDEGKIRRYAEEMGIDLADSPLVHEPNVRTSPLLS